MNKNQRKSLGVILGIAIVLIVVVLRPIVQTASKEVSSSSSQSSAASAASSGTNGILPSAPIAGQNSSSDLFDALNQLQARLEKGTPETNRQLLAEFFRNRVGREVSEERAGELIRFLDSGADSATGLRFRMGPGHVIQDWPTLRVAVLDWLGALSPVQAAAYAETIFSQANSGDEYAVALRNFSLGNPGDKAALTKHFIALLQNEKWEAMPTAGYLEAYDVAVYLGDASVVGPLVDQFAGSTNQSVRNASFISLDRLAQVNPDAVLPAALKNPSLATAPRTRAGLLARSDIRQADQRTLLESYLLDPAVSKEEISFFVQAFPNGSGVMVHGLLSENRAKDFADLAQQDAFALKQIQQWQLDKRFEQRWPALKQLEDRLVKYVASAVRGGLLNPTLVQ